jgi:predicted Rossmann fold nucleotide-binding protein DprA/Smf involved in DNA uptake
MTTREYIVNTLNAHISAEMDEKSTALLEAMDRKNAQRKGKPSKATVANEPIKAQLIERLGDEPVTSAALAEGLGLTTAKVASLMGVLHREGKVNSTDVKVGKSKVKGWTLAQ